MANYLAHNSRSVSKNYGMSREQVLHVKRKLERDIRIRTPVIRSQAQSVIETWDVCRPGEST